MSRTGWSTSNYLIYAGLPGSLSGAPLTMACWARAGTLSTQQILMGLFTSGSTNFRSAFLLWLSSGDTLTAQAAPAGSPGGTAQATSTPALDTWFHAAGVFASSSSRSVYLNGANKGTDTTAATPSGLNRTAVGVGGGTPGTPFTGPLAEAAIWNIALSDAEVAKLAAGMSPLKMHPEALVGYWPLLGDASPERNLLSNTSILSVQGSLSAAAHPRIFRE